MRKTILILLLVSGLCGCGSSNGISDLVDDQGNFISTTVDVDRQFLYSLDPTSGRISGFVVTDEEPEEGEEEQILPLEELDGSPYSLGAIGPIGFVTSNDGRFLYLLQADGLLRIYAIDGYTGLLSDAGILPTNVANARLIQLSEDGATLAVLGDDLALYALRDDGSFPLPARLPATATWVDLTLDGNVGVASTAAGAVGFSFISGTSIVPTPEVVLPGATRGGLVSTDRATYVVNSEDASLSALTQDASGSLSLAGSIPLPGVSNPRLIERAFESNTVVVAGDDSVATLDATGSTVEEIGTATISSAASTLFAIPGSSLVLVGHSPRAGIEILDAAETEISVVEDGDITATAFGFAQRTERITQTVPY